MRITGLSLFAIAICLFAIACGTTNPAAPTNERAPVAQEPSIASTPDVVASMRPVFKEHCAECHGESGAGGVVTVKGKEIRVPNLTGEHARKPTDEKLAGKIREGDDDMPSFKGKLSEEQINNLVLFIRKEIQKQ